MKLDLVVPRYKEPWDVCKYLFDSIALQRGIDFDDIRVLVINDGDENVLDAYAWRDYPYRVDYIIKPHGGVSHTRNVGIDESDADYIMFCDIDDGFLNNYGLHLVFSAMQEHPKMITSCFVEEVKTDTWLIVRHDKDPTFIHGKAYDRKWLVENNIRFDDDLTIHEDSYFNNIAIAHAKDDRKDITTPFYLWRWNDASTVRRESGNFLLKTYPKLVQVRTRICDEMKSRGFEDAYKLCMVKSVTDFYYDFQKPDFNRTENRRDIKEAEKAVRAFYMAHQKEFLRIERGYIADVCQSSRDIARRNGFLMEYKTLQDWLKYIEYEVK